MSDSEEVPQHKQTKKTVKSSKAPAVAAIPSVEYAILPEKGGASMDTSSWPLLLKVTFIKHPQIARAIWCGITNALKIKPHFVALKAKKEYKILPL
jgi:hypothetical protein